MAHLKKDAVTGHLLKHPVSGHLIKTCQCPTDCSACTEDQVIVSGFEEPGDDCDALNMTVPLTRDGCSWSGSNFTGLFGGWLVQSLVCTEGFWVLTMMTCAGTYRGTKPASSCPAGTYSLEWISGGNDYCAGDHQAVVGTA